jgi:tetratricopeptide (TPR) repeat protein
MRKNNLNKSKNSNEKGAAGKHRRRLIPSKKADSGKRTSSDESAIQPISGRNSTWTEILTENPELDAMLERGIQLRRQGRFQAAVRVLKAAVQHFPDHAPVLWYLGGIYLHDLNQAQKAIPFFRKAARLCPQSRRASLGLFHALWDLGRQREAMRELRRFQSVARCDDYVKILAEVRKNAPELFNKPVKPKGS